MRIQLAAALLLIAAPARAASTPWWPENVNAHYSTDLPADAVPYPGWRLIQTFTAGLSDFLFETTVMKPVLLPAGRVDDTTKAELDYGVTGYPRRFGELLRRALLREGEKLLTQTDAPRFTLSLDLVTARPLPAGCGSPRCESLSLSDAAAIVFPPASSWLERRFYAALASIKVSAIMAPTDAEKALAHAGRTLYSADVVCVQGEGCH